MGGKLYNPFAKKVVIFQLSSNKRSRAASPPKRNKYMHKSLDGKRNVKALEAKAWIWRLVVGSDLCCAQGTNAGTLCRLSCCAQITFHSKAFSAKGRQSTLILIWQSCGANAARWHRRWSWGRTANQANKERTLHVILFFAKNSWLCGRYLGDIQATSDFTPVPTLGQHLSLRYGRLKHNIATRPLCGSCSNHRLLLSHFLQKLCSDDQIIFARRPIHSEVESRLGQLCAWHSGNRILGELLWRHEAHHQKKDIWKYEQSHRRKSTFTGAHLCLKSRHKYNHINYHQVDMSDTRISDTTFHASMCTVQHCTKASWHKSSTRNAESQTPKWIQQTSLHS